MEENGGAFVGRKDEEGIHTTGSPVTTPSGSSVGTPPGTSVGTPPGTSVGTPPGTSSSNGIVENGKSHDDDSAR